MACGACDTVWLECLGCGCNSNDFCAASPLAGNADDGEETAPECKVVAGRRYRPCKHTPRQLAHLDVPQPGGVQLAAAHSAVKLALVILHTLPGVKLGTAAQGQAV